MALRHVVVERGDPSKENIKSAWNWDFGRQKKSQRRKERKRGLAYTSARLQSPKSRTARCAIASSTTQTEERTHSLLTDLVSLTEWTPLNTMKF